MLVKLITKDLHENISHVYGISSLFSLIRKIVSDYVTYARFNKNTIKINQSHYHNERLNPSNIPFLNLYLDYMERFLTLSRNRSKSKFYILVFSCTWSRTNSVLDFIWRLHKTK